MMISSSPEWLPNGVKDLQSIFLTSVSRWIELSQLTSLPRAPNLSRFVDKSMITFAILVSLSGNNLSRMFSHACSSFVDGWSSHALIELLNSFLSTSSALRHAGLWWAGIVRHVVFTGESMVRLIGKCGNIWNTKCWGYVKVKCKFQ